VKTLQLKKVIKVLDPESTNLGSDPAKPSKEIADAQRL
jgi:hypothetical protein